MDKLSIEQVHALFFDEDALTESPYKLFRIDGGSSRYYYEEREGEDGESKLIFYPSITSVIGRTLPKDEHIVKWIAEMGYEEAIEYRNAKGDYGTAMHIVLAEYLINGEVDTANIAEEYPDYFDDLCSDLLAFAKFVEDYKVKPLAVEIGVIDRELGIAGFLDLVCEMTILVEKLDHENPFKSGKRKGEPRPVKVDEQIVAIVDFKSGRKGFYEAHEIQVNWYRKAWNQIGLGAEATRCYNWAPKEWRTDPTYSLKDQTESQMFGKLPHLKACFDITYADGKPKPIRNYMGVVKRGEALTENYRTMEIEEVILGNEEKPKTEEKQEESNEEQNS